MKNIIIAPAASGKTYFTNRYNMSGLVVDGDDVIRDTVGWPETPGWWEDPELSVLVNQRNREALTQYAHNNQDKLILFNPGNDGVFAEDVYGAVMIPQGHHLTNAAKRRASGNTSQPRSAVEILGDRERHKMMIEEMDLRVFESFHAAKLAFEATRDSL